MSLPRSLELTWAGEAPSPLAVAVPLPLPFPLPLAWPSAEVRVWSAFTQNAWKVRPSIFV